ncbi:uncharacterized protein METZ01_LOCUS416273, partial [marine metagenome]
MSISNIVDTDRYPFDDWDGAAYKKLVSRCRQQLEQDGCCLLPNFLKPNALDDAKQEAIALASGGFQMNHYFAYDDVNDETLSRNLNCLPKDHPRRFKSLTKIRFIARDLISQVNPLHRVHDWPNMSTFLRDALQIPAIYPNECPLSSCVFTVAERGELQDWHFDGNHFIVTLMLEDSDEGGHFEFVRGLREPDKEDDFESISQVINGNYPAVSRPVIKPGTLTVFRGKDSLHRASAVEGDGRRIMSVL